MSQDDPNSEKPKLRLSKDIEKDDLTSSNHESAKPKEPTQNESSKAPIKSFKLRKPTPSESSETKNPTKPTPELDKKAPEGDPLEQKTVKPARPEVRSSPDTAHANNPEPIKPPEPTERITEEKIAPPAPDTQSTAPAPEKDLSLDRDRIAANTRPQPKTLPTEPIAPTLKEESSHSHLLVSILCIAALLLLLITAGYGIYRIFKEPVEEGLANQAPSSIQPKAPSTPKEEEAPAPIIEVADPEIVSEPVAQVDALANEAQPLPEPVDFTSEVTEYLSSVYVGGMRTGSSPRVMLNEVTYRKGETINPATGLSLVGIEDQKLIFQDANGVLYKKSF
jgi:hypothetical protein